MAQEKIERMKHLCNFLRSASIHYYKYDNPIISDKKYDDFLDELISLENDTGIIMNDSPTQHVQGEVLDSLKKVKHSKQMLSANKTKDMNDIKQFISDKKVVVSWKLDGLTIVLRYKNGNFVQAITRGRDGLIGEDVTHTIKHCSNIPMKIKYCADIEVRGECVISWNNFEKINETLDTKYSHPRNLAAGSVRLLDSNLSKERNIKFIAFELNQEYWPSYSQQYDSENQLFDTIDKTFNYLKECGFDVVEHVVCDKSNIQTVFNQFVPEEYEFPVDGLIVKYNDYYYGQSLGVTSHHPLDMIAFKWKDETYETVLRDVEWNTSKTGLINPVAIFDEIELEGASTTRATLHNVSYIEDLQLGIGDRITVYRSNMVIPKVDDNLDRSNTLEIPTKCPSCGSETTILNENGSKTLHCFNDNCPSQKLSKFVHFVSKDGANIDGLSEATLEKFINLGWLNELKDIYHLDKYSEKLSHLSGFGKRSANKLYKNIELSRHISLNNFLTSLSIPLIGKTACKTVSTYLHASISDFMSKIKDGFDWTILDGFGQAMNDSIYKYFDKNIDMVEELIKEFEFVESESTNEKNSNLLKGLNFVITGKVHLFKNRSEIKKLIESCGGKVTGSVTSKTSYLINNDVNSSSSKNKKAKQLGIPIINEEQFNNML